MMNMSNHQNDGRPPPAESNDAGTECRRGSAESNDVRTLPDAGNRNLTALERFPTREIGSKWR